jgi:hypothetical protein
MRKTLAAIATAGASALGIIPAGPTSAHSTPPPLSLAGSNCTAAGGVCVFPDATRVERYEAVIVTNDGTTDTFTVVAGSLPLDISLANNGTQGAILIGTQGQSCGQRPDDAGAVAGTCQQPDRTMTP